MNEYRGARALRESSTRRRAVREFIGLKKPMPTNMLTYRIQWVTTSVPAVAAYHLDREISRVLTKRRD